MLLKYGYKNAEMQKKKFDNVKLWYSVDGPWPKSGIPTMLACSITTSIETQKALVLLAVMTSIFSRLRVPERNCGEKKSLRTLGARIC